MTIINEFKKKSYEEELAELNQKEAELREELELEKARERVRILQEQISQTRRSHQSDNWWDHVPTCLMDTRSSRMAPRANISPREVFIQSFLKDLENGLR